MPVRKFLSALVALALVGALAGCAKKSDTATSVESSTTTTSESKASTTTTSSSSGSSSNGTIPDLGNLGNLSECLKVAGTYASLFLGLLSPNASDSDKAQVQQQLDEIKAQVPADVQKDLQTIEDGLKSSNSFSDIAKFLDSDKFKSADANVQKYLDQQCGSGSNN